MKQAHQAGQIKTPRQPRKGVELLGWAKDVTTAIQQLRDRKVFYSGGGVGGIMDAPISWKLTMSKDGSDHQWQVASKLSTITDGTNGPAIDLTVDSAKWASGAIKFDVATTISETRWIVLEAEVSSVFALSDFTFKAVATRAEAQEIKFLTTGTLQQSHLRLLIGKITFTDGVPKIVQGEKTEQFVDWGILNARAIKCFISPQKDPDNLT